MLNMSFKFWFCLLITCLSFTECFGFEIIVKFFRLQIFVKRAIANKGIYFLFEALQVQM